MKKKSFAILALLAMSLTLPFASCSDDDDTKGQTPVDPEVVDLGLPSGRLWAKCNVGATKPEEFGLYFAWGETEGYTNDDDVSRSFNWSSYKWCKGTYNTFTKYCHSKDDGYEGFTDLISELDLEDDAAYVNKGDKWRMPSDWDITELCNNTTSEWTTENGVPGRKFIGKNGNSIFIPAAGKRLDNIFTQGNTSGSIWSRTLSLSNVRQAYVLESDSDDKNPTINYSSRYSALPLRPVLR